MYKQKIFPPDRKENKSNNYSENKILHNDRNHATS